MRQEQYCDIIAHRYEDEMTLTLTHQMHQVLWCLSRTLFVRTFKLQCSPTTVLASPTSTALNRLRLANTDNLCLVATASLSVNLSAFHRHLRFSRFQTLFTHSLSGTPPLLSFKNDLSDSRAGSLRPGYPHHRD